MTQLKKKVKNGAITDADLTNLSKIVPKGNTPETQVLSGIIKMAIELHADTTKKEKALASAKQSSKKALDMKEIDVQAQIDKGITIQNAISDNISTDIANKVAWLKHNEKIRSTSTQVEFQKFYDGIKHKMELEKLIETYMSGVEITEDDAEMTKEEEEDDGVMGSITDNAEDNAGILKLLILHRLKKMGSKVWKADRKKKVNEARK